MNDDPVRAPGYAPWFSALPASWRVMADLLLSPSEFDCYDRHTLLPMMRLAWELTGSLLEGRRSDVKSRWLNFQPLCLGSVHNPRYCQAVVDQAKKLATVRGWTLVESTETSPGSAEPARQRLPGMDKSNYARGVKLRKLHLMRVRTVGDLGRAVGQEDNRLPPGLIPTPGTLSLLGELRAMPLFYLLWQIMHALYCRNKWTIEFSVAQRIMYTRTDWEALTTILASRGWRMIPNHEPTGTLVSIMELED